MFNKLKEKIATISLLRKMLVWGIAGLIIIAASLGAPEFVVNLLENAQDLIRNMAEQPPEEIVRMFGQYIYVA